MIAASVATAGIAPALARSSPERDAHRRRAPLLPGLTGAA